MRAPIRKIVLALSLVIILVIFIIIFVAYREVHGPQTHGRLPLPSPTLQQAAGMPAIPRTSNGVPAFTKADVINYITTHDMPFTDTPGSTISVGEKDISFITSAEVNKIINRQGTGIPDKYLLCFARLTGAFTFPSPPSDGKKPASVTYTQAYEVFDATTGNLLMGGALGQPSPPIG